jgi:uncharacterized RmlC-like cupin family protein
MVRLSLRPACALTEFLQIGLQFRVVMARELNGSSQLIPKVVTMCANAATVLSRR